MWKRLFFTVVALIVLCFAASAALAGDPRSYHGSDLHDMAYYVDHGYEVKYSSASTDTEGDVRIFIQKGNDVKVCDVIIRYALSPLPEFRAPCMSVSDHLDDTNKSEDK